MFIIFSASKGKHVGIYYEMTKSLNLIFAPNPIFVLLLPAFQQVILAGRHYLGSLLYIVFPVHPCIGKGSSRNFYRMFLLLQ